MYALLKVIHVVAVIMFVGNITVGIFWKTFADMTGDLRIIAHSLRGIILADRIFTIPGILLLLIGGFGAAAVGHWPILSTGWILWSLGLFILAGIAFGPVSRSQRQMEATARAGVESGALDKEKYDAYSRTWNTAGIIALIAPLVAVVLMIAKPDLPAFHR